MKRQSKKITAVYCRVDSVADTVNTMAIQFQQKALTQYAAEHGMTDLEMFIDCGFSGTTLNRPELQRLIRAIKAGTVKTVLISDGSRISRKATHFCYFVDKVLAPNNVSLCIVREGVRTKEQLEQYMSAFHPLRRFGGERGRE